MLTDIYEDIEIMSVKELIALKEAIDKQLMLRNAIPQLDNDWSDGDGHIFGINDW